jgi:hypothetical protein
MSCCFHDRKAICGFGRGDFGAIGQAAMSVGSLRNLEE